MKKAIQTAKNGKNKNVSRPCESNRPARAKEPRIRRRSQMANKISGKKINGQAKVDIGIMKFIVSGSTRLSAFENQFLFELDSLKVGFLPLPKPVLDGISYEINKSLAIDNFPLEVKDVIVQDGKISITFRVIKSDNYISESQIE